MNIYTKMGRKFVDIILITILIIPQIIQCQTNPYFLTLSQHDLTVIVGETESVQLISNGQLDKNVNLTFVKQHTNLVDIKPPWIYLQTDEPKNSSDIKIKGLHPGHLEVYAETTPVDTLIAKDVFIRVTVANSWNIYYVSVVFGWIYFVAWSISFYPQMITNFKRKSVVGLNFDFIALNIVGFMFYSIFNVSLYWIPEIENEYFHRTPRGLNPVLINDILFSLHAVFATCITIFQCIIYERGEQKISLTALGILGIFAIIVIVSATLAGVAVIHWLDFLYICSYIKLAITLIKYIPQAVMNFRRKSTSGWSIGNILLDFIGGILSMLQMILNSHNYDDWDSIFGDPTKFGLGLFSVCFDIFFMLQHYVFYRNNAPYDEIRGSVETTPFVNEQQEDNLDREAGSLG